MSDSDSLPAESFKKRSTLPPAFKIVFLVVVGFTSLSFVGIGALALLGNSATNPADLPIAQQNFANACSFGWQAGLGAILGLIGGKVTE